MGYKSTSKTECRRLCQAFNHHSYQSNKTEPTKTVLYPVDSSTINSSSPSFAGDGATMMEIDHDLRQVFCEQMKVPDMAFPGGALLPTDEALSQRLTTPIVTTYVDTEKISFERSKGGLWDWR